MIIEGKVAAILNERDLVINRGSDAGVKEGMKFKVIEPQFPITDPDTGASLGAVSREKIRVRIIEAQPRFSVGKTYETYVINVGVGIRDSSPLEMTATIQRSQQQVTRVRTLMAENTSRFDPLDEASSFVKVGDPVVQVEEEILEKK